MDGDCQSGLPSWGALAPQGEAQDTLDAVDAWNAAIRGSRSARSEVDPHVGTRGVKADRYGEGLKIPADVLDITPPPVAPDASALARKRLTAANAAQDP